MKIKGMPDVREEKYTREDRDLLITVNTKLDSVIKTVDDLKNNTMARIEALERSKANEAEVEKIYTTRVPKWDDFSRRIENLELHKSSCEEYRLLDRRMVNLEDWRWYIIGLFSLLGVVIALVVFIYLRDIGDIKASLEKHIDSFNNQQMINNNK